MSAELKARPLLEFTAAEACNAMNRSFEEYYVPLVFDAASFERRFRGENVDAQASKLWFRGEELVGLVLIARRGWTSRVAAMGLVVEARGQGMGTVMLADAIADATARGDRSLLLEVFTANERARRLYERLGFFNTRLLTIFNCPTVSSSGSLTQVEEVDPREVARVLAHEAEVELPWMIAPETVAAAAPPSRAFQLEGKAYAVVRVDPNRTMLLALVVPREWRRQGWGTQLLQVLEAKYAGHNFMAAMVLEGPAYSFLQQRGWTANPLTLLEMERPISSVPLS